LPFENDRGFDIIGRVAWRLEETDDGPRWDRFVLAHPEYSITHGYGWGELKAAFGWRPRRFLLYEGDTPHAGAQILSRPLPVVGGELWYAPRGLLVDYADAVTLAALTAALRERARGAGAVVLKIEPMAAGRELAQLAELGWRRAGHGVQPQRTLYLDLSRSEDELLAGMDRRTRYNVNLAGRKGVTVRASRDAADLKIFYRLLEETTERQHFLVHNLAYYEKVLELLGPAGTLLVAEREGEALAASFVLAFGRYAYYAHAASAARRRELKAANKLVWEAIRWAKGAGYKVFDFWGIPREPSPRNPLHGVYAFKKGFGGEVVEFGPAYDLPLRPITYRILNVALALKSAGRNLRARGTLSDPMGN
jgi:lipid II:glycine glycyltransferase (peptidoglycan interpeptide bridge formation enzyme)